MKRLVFIILLLFVQYASNAQTENEPKVGDELVVNKPQGERYNHISFPQLNIIAKRGKIANYKSVYGNHVIIKDVIKKDNGDVLVILKKKNGGKFFNFLKHVEANYKKALDTGELSLKGK